MSKKTWIPIPHINYTEITSSLCYLTGHYVLTFIGTSTNWGNTVEFLEYICPCPYLYICHIFNPTHILYILWHLNYIRYISYPSRDMEWFDSCHQNWKCLIHPISLGFFSPPLIWVVMGESSPYECHCCWHTVAYKHEGALRVKWVSIPWAYSCVFSPFRGLHMCQIS